VAQGQPTQGLYSIAPAAGLAVVPVADKACQVKGILASQSGKILPGSKEIQILCHIPKSTNLFYATLAYIRHFTFAGCFE
jgi:hypothetical protein